MLATITFKPKLRDDGAAMTGPPFSTQFNVSASGLQIPVEHDLAAGRRQRAVLGGIGGKLVQRQRQALRGRRLQRNVGSLELYLVAGPVWRQFVGDQSGEIGAVPA